MRPVKLRDSTPFRLAVTFTLLLVAAFSICGLIVFSFIKSELSTRHDERIKATFDVLARTGAKDNAQALADLVRIHQMANPTRENVFLFKSADGKITQGNIPFLPLNDGFSNLPSVDLGIDQDYDYRLYKGDVPSGSLVVGASNGEIDEVTEIALAGIIWASLVAVAIAAAGGAGLAKRAQQRFDALRTTFDDIAKGELSSRIRLLGNGDDIDRLASDVNGALDRLQSVIEGMKQVSADIAHDLRTPLNRLRMHIEKANESLEAGIPPGEHLAMAQDECERISETFSALLRIAQIESGSRREKFTRVDLASIMNEVCEVFAPVAEDAGMTLSCRTEDIRMSIVQGDRELLTQALVNLVENAIVHCPAGSNIKCALDGDGKTLTLEVRDNGPGIPAHMREKVLQRLFRMEKSRTTPGSGLGLSLVKAVADLHNARMILSDANPGLIVELQFGTAGPINKLG